MKTVFFSPAKIAFARAYQEELEIQKEQEKVGKEAERERKAAERKQKAEELQERKENRLRIRAEKLAQKERNKEARTLQNQINQQIDFENWVSKKRIQKPVMVEKKESSREFDVEVKEPETRIAQSGRIISRPTRFRD